MSERTFCCVFSQPVDGREAEYHEWYDSRHLTDVLRVPGVVSAQRFNAVAGGPRADPSLPSFLAIYEIEGDPIAVASELAARFATDQMPASGALDLGHVSMTFWQARRDPVTRPGLS